jgi:hypothetical protein
VHDFGLYRYDPAKLRFIEPRRAAAASGGRADRPRDPRDRQQRRRAAVDPAGHARQARPARAELRHRQVQRLQHVLPAGRIGTSGGSSGSPVVDIRGRVVGLNAGGATGAASSFYLPLGRVKRALELIQAGKPVTRGTLQTVFTYTPFDELRRLGLDGPPPRLPCAGSSPSTRHAGGAEVQPGSTATALQPGDILVRSTAATSRSSSRSRRARRGCGAGVELELKRGGQTVPRANLVVGDLHAITPDEYLEFGDAHPAYAVMAAGAALERAGQRRVRREPGLRVRLRRRPARRGHPRVNGQQIADLDDFVELLGHWATAPAPRALHDARGSERPQLRSVRMDRRWFPARRCVRDDASGIWALHRAAAVAAARRRQPGSTTFAWKASRALDPARAFAGAGGFDMPYSVSGVTERNYYGTGLSWSTRARPRGRGPQHRAGVARRRAAHVRGHARGAGTRRVHPSRCTTSRWCAYDPAADRCDPGARRALRPREPFAVGERSGWWGSAAMATSRSRSTQVADVGPVVFPLSRTLQFRDANLEWRRWTTGPVSTTESWWTTAATVLASLVELRVRDRPRSPAENQRRARSSSCSRCSTCAHGTAAAFARGRVLARCRSRRHAGSASPDVLDPPHRASTAARSDRYSAIARLVGRLARGHAAAPGRPAARRGRQIVSPRSGRSSARWPTRASAGDRVARRCGASISVPTVALSRRGCRPRRGLGRSDAAGAASRDVGAARHSARRRVRRFLHVRLAGDAARLWAGPTDRRGRRVADAGSRRLPRGVSGRPDRSSVGSAP